MKYLVFAVYDIKSEAFGMPLYFAAKGQAIRAFDDQVNQEQNSMMAKHPADYELFQIGEYTDHDGYTQPLQQPVSHGKATDFKNED